MAGVSTAVIAVTYGVAVPIKNARNNIRKNHLRRIMVKMKERNYADCQTAITEPNRCGIYMTATGSDKSAITRKSRFPCCSNLTIFDRGRYQEIAASIRGAARQAQRRWLCRKMTRSGY
jgi:hypothetical protein